MKSPLQKTRAALKRSRQNLAKLASSKRDATSGLPVFEADTYARSPSESSLTKAKRSDYNLKELSESSESSDEEAGPRLPRKADAKGRRSWALVLVAAACVTGAGYAATRAAQPSPILHADRSLRTATDLFRRAAAADGLRSAEFTRATDALNPFLEALVRAPCLMPSISRRWRRAPRPIDNGSVHTAPGPRAARPRQRRQAAERRRRVVSQINRGTRPR